VEYHTGRLLDHVHLRVSDLERSARFYAAVLDALAAPIELVRGPGFFAADELFVSQGDGPLSSVHLAFQTPDRETVGRFHAAALAAGGTDNGAPGERSYHPGYYAAYALDPDGNNVEAVFHGAATRSAGSVVITPAPAEPAG
jgi:catechol 2,3-dioxygenase-like lactoylglutathione lyase family enzyme